MQSNWICLSDFSNDEGYVNDKLTFIFILNVHYIYHASLSFGKNTDLLKLVYMGAFVFTNVLAQRRIFRKQSVHVLKILNVSTL